MGDTESLNQLIQISLIGDFEYPTGDLIGYFLLLVL
jgi:hypothetical protein